ncbi:MAG TPA: AraC family transcriptional regulator [Rhizomicrobium sp.]|jgi:AraC family transcriptional regulator|nr:AraC family transcriptional regulator [Rhizomicrobium sp.]
MSETGSDFLADVLAHVEAHLTEPLSVQVLADVAGLSPYYFSRAFTVRLGESVMGYVRDRRLEKAAMRLMSAKPPALIELAFDCGFESQEAFTRAFRRRFGVPPGQFQRQTAMQPREKPMSSTVAVQRVTALPELLYREAFTVAGPRAVFHQDNKSGIPALWPRLIKCLPLAGQVDARTYGVGQMVDPSEGAFSYMAGVEVKGDAPQPAGFEKIEIPAGKYAVFRIVIDGSELHPQMQAAMSVIWGEMMPKSGHKLAQRPDFELYPADFDQSRKGAHIDICLPVEG